MRIHIFDTTRVPPADPPSDRPTDDTSPPPASTPPILDVREVWARAGSAVRTSLPRSLQLTATVTWMQLRGHNSCELELSPSHGVSSNLSLRLRAHLSVSAYDAITVKLGRPLDLTQLVHRDITLTCTPVWLPDGRMRLTVTDIGPNWRVSAVELQRAQGLDALARAGLLDAQRRLPQPTHLERISVLHPPGQGWEDVAGTLTALEGAGLLQVDSLPCPFDGQGAVAQVVERLDAAAALHRGREDRGLVLMVRGGGSPARALDAKEVAGAIGTLTVPVAVAVGHRTDAPTLADLTAWASLPTPSEARHLILTLLEGSAMRAEEAWRRLMASLDDLDARLRRTMTDRCEAVADEAEACLAAAERRAETASLGLEHGLERALAALMPACNSGLVPPAPIPVQRIPSPDGLVRLTDQAGRPVADAATASGLLTITFGDGRSISVRVEPLDPTTLH